MERIGTRVGPYRLLRRVGEGGMGQVYAAVHERLGQAEVALKLLSPDSARDPELVARLRREGRALASVPHPGVVRVLDCEQLPDGTVYLITELLQGQSLRAWMSQKPGVGSRAESLEIARALAEVLVEVHSQGIVHRDLKPENAFLCDDPASAWGYRVKLLDFGIAKVPPPQGAFHLDTHVQTQSQGERRLGTPRYMAPEQLMDAAGVDGQVDVYALGVLLFELLAGRPPFLADSNVELAIKHEQETPPFLQELVSDLPETLARFVAAMLAKAPADRPSMRECLARLEQRWEEGNTLLPGLAAFTEAQRDLFFGRQRDQEAVSDLIERSRAGTSRCVRIEGADGVGKTSLLEAGVLPHLTRAAPVDSPRWFLVRPRPATLRESFPPRWEESSPPEGRVLVVLDPLEDFLGLDDADRHWLDDRLSTALSAPEGRVRLLTALREGSLFHLDRLPRLARHLGDAPRHVLRPLEGETLARVIRSMSQRVGLSLAEGLPEQMVREATSEGVHLPWLFHSLQWLRAAHGGGALTHEEYKRLGGLNAALARQAEALLEGLSPEGREQARRMLLSLVQVPRGLPAIRRSRSRTEVLAAAGRGASAEAVLARLSGSVSASPGTHARPLPLVVLSAESNAPRVGLLHDALLREVPLISRWIAQERTRLERLSDLENRSEHWARAKHPGDNLLTGSLLADFMALARTPEGGWAGDVSDRSARFLEASRRFDRRRSFLRLTAVSALASTTAWALVEKFRADASFQWSIGLVDTVVSDLDWSWSRRHHTWELRVQMLDAVLSALRLGSARDLASSRGVQIMAKALHRRGDFAFLDESLSKTQTYLEEARTVLREGRTRHGEDPDILFRLGLNASKWGKVFLARGQFRQARGAFDEADALLRPRPPGHGEDDHRRTRATSLAERAELELAEGHPEVALPLLSEAIDLLARNPGDYDQALLAEAWTSRAETAAALGDWTTAQRDAHAALKRLKELRSEDLANTYFQWVQARLLVILAGLEGLEWPSSITREQGIRESLEHGRELLKGEPPNKRYALVLAHGLSLNEQWARTRGDVTRADELQGERCRVVAEFMRRDPQDTRFARWKCD
ncbi:nSTAND1 domain-containing NTPase [Melittangium boletus]|uniref:serine/threonine-protein kinase n=1 Tax=Melittangium boletus TaxID=83453 RepID=UPI003DA577DF